LAQDQVNGGTWTASQFGNDAHGNIRYLTDGAGRATDSFEYDAFGSLIGHTGHTPASKMYNGEEFDGDLGMYNLRARYQHPGTGRFWTRDTFEGYQDAPSSLNAYTYTGNNPVNMIDPRGHDEMSMAEGISAMMAPAMDSLFAGTMNYVNGLDGGATLKADNGTTALFIESLSEHVGINLGQEQFFNTMQGAPFLLANDPNVYCALSTCFQKQVLAFSADAPVYGCGSREPVFTLQMVDYPGYRAVRQSLEPVYVASDVLGYLASDLAGYGDGFQGNSLTFHNLDVNASRLDPAKVRANIALETLRAEAGVATFGLSDGAVSLAQGNYKQAQETFALSAVTFGVARELSELDALGGAPTELNEEQAVNRANEIGRTARGEGAEEELLDTYNTEYPGGGNPDAAVVPGVTCPGTSCFVAGTLVAAEAGLAEIEKVKAGDRVWSFNKDTCQWELKLVERTFVRDYEGDIITLELGESVIESTGNHPFWVELGEGLAERPQPNLPVQLSQTNHPGRWVEARDLRRGDVLLGKDGQQVVVRGCTSRMDNLPVYNFQVADNHSYAVSKCCVLVHNVCPPQAAEGTENFVNLASPSRTTHILTGDGPGSGGHLWPGQAGKTPFPQSWSGDKIMHEVSDIATDPAYQWVRPDGKTSWFYNSGKPARFKVIDPATGGCQFEVAYQSG